MIKREKERAGHTLNTDKIYLLFFFKDITISSVNRVRADRANSQIRMVLLTTTGCKSQKPQQYIQDQGRHTAEYK